MRSILPTAAFAAACSLSSPAVAQSDPAPNVLLIVLDDVGTDKLRFYGETPTTCVVGSCTACSPAVYPVTPTLRGLRESGVLFTRAYGTPTCSPTRACIQTGRYGFRTGIGGVLATSGSTAKLSDSEVFLPELLRNGFSGPPGVGLPYQCAAFGKWHLTTSTGNDSHAVDNGYERFYGTIENVSNHFIWTKIEHDSGSTSNTVAIDGSTSATPYDVDTWDASVNRADAVTWINAQHKSFFAYVAFNPPHAPLQVPPSSLLSTATLSELACHPGGPFAAGDIALDSDPADQQKLFFRAMMEAVDTEIGQLIAGIDDDKLANTTIIVMGDNGTSEHVMDVPPHVTGHWKSTVYEGGVRVPLIVKSPFVPTPIPSGGYTCSQLVAAVDLWRTLAAITGASETLAAPITPLDSISFLPLISNPTATGSRTSVFVQRFTDNGVTTLPTSTNTCYSANLRAIRGPRYKYHRIQTSVSSLPVCSGSSAPTYSEELYDLLTDAQETTNLVSSTTAPIPAILNSLRSSMTTLSGN